MVLDALKPYNDCLKRLGIVKYLGLEFPKWVGDPSFHRLSRVSVSGCKKCTSLPPLGQLPSLKRLSIQNMDDVKDVGLEFLGAGVAFPSLEILKFQVSLKAPLFSLRDLRIHECGAGLLRSLVHAAPSVTKLEIGSTSGLTNEVCGCVILDLKAVEELKLFVTHCKNMVSLGEKDEYNYGSNLITSLSSCYSMACVSFSTGGGQKLKSVTFFDCENLLLKELGGGEKNRLLINSKSMPMLEIVCIIDHPNVASIIEFEGNFMHLTVISSFEFGKQPHIFLEL
nr:hypothetical protein [Tanacetum cinerariifolium]